MAENCFSDTARVSKHTFSLFLRRKSAESFTFIKQIRENITFALQFPPNAPIIKAKECVLLSATYDERKEKT